MIRCVLAHADDVRTICRAAQVRRAWRDAASDDGAAPLWRQLSAEAWPSTGGDAPADPRRLYRGMSRAMRAGLSVVLPWPQSPASRRPPLMALEHLSFCVDIRFGAHPPAPLPDFPTLSPAAPNTKRCFPAAGQVVHSATVPGAAPAFPVLVDVALPQDCILRQPGVNLNSEDIVGTHLQPFASRGNSL